MTGYFKVVFSAFIMVCVLLIVTNQAVANTEVNATAGAFGNDFTLTSDNASPERYTIKAAADFKGLIVEPSGGTVLTPAGTNCKDLGGKIFCALDIDQKAVISAVGSNAHGDNISIEGNFPETTISIEGKIGDDLLDATKLTAPAALLSLDGGIGIDTVSTGQTASSTLIGGQGKDTLSGGAGNDTFKAEATPDGNDTIKQADQGLDCVSYQTRTVRVVVRATNQAESGDVATGEQDTIPAETPCIIGGKGNDLLELSATEPSTGKTHQVHGGDGEDSIIGSQSADSLIGGKDDDIINGDAGADVINGDAGKDTLHGSNGEDTISGGADNDQVFGEEDNDTLNGNDGEDRLEGEAGNDKLQASYSVMAGDGSDSYSGGTGNDELSFDAYPIGADLTISLDNVANDGLAGEQDNVNSSTEDIFTGAGTDTIQGSPEDNEIHSGAGEDTIQGGNGNDTIDGQAGNDTLRGEGDDDLLLTSSEDDVFDGGAGKHDTVDYTQAASKVDVTVDGLANDGIAGEQDNVQSNIETVIGSPFDDKLTNTGATIMRLAGGAGNDTLEGGTFIDTLEGNEDNDTLRGNESDDVLLGGPGTDELLGGTQDDQLDGGPGDDIVKGEAGIDTLISGSDGNDDLSGGAGDDILSYQAALAKITVSLDDQKNDGVTINGEEDNAHSDIEQIDGSAFDDTIVGDNNKNVLRGNDGNDQLEGGTGADSLNGGAGNDFISSRDQSIDDVNCGADFDTATTDETDQVSLDCEQVRLPQQPISPPPVTDLHPLPETPGPVVTPNPPPQSRVCTVPNLRRKTVKRASRLIRTAGLKAGTTKRRRVKARRYRGRVVSQSPKAGKKVRCGSSVRITVGSPTRKR